MPESNYEVIQLDSNSWRIEDSGVRTFLFAGTEKALLVDTGFGSGDLLAEVKKLTQLPIVLVNTHADDDHIGCNAQFEETNMHPSEFFNYINRRPDAKVKPLWEGDVIDIGGRCFEVILLPGHTPGSIALIDREAKIIIIGDSVSETPVFIFGEMRSKHAYINTLDKLLAMQGSFDEIYTSHGRFPLEPEYITNLKACAIKLINGELKPMEPLFEIPAKMYVSDGAAFYDY